ncbi:DUF4186 domain-containing protein [Methylobacter sp. Wu1]|uniref:DUF4186 domain-containing protein n=1 Tax=Methylobacter sp. Wu1 TaxID=3119359 RepID=UPI002F939EB4
MRDLDELFAALSKSAFRRKFHLQSKDLVYLKTKGLPTVINHARDFIAKRLAPAVIDNDGKQTPFRGHPVFVAQHATACCCRGCLEKWHGIPKGHVLTPDQEAYAIKVIERWLQGEMANKTRQAGV